MYPCMPYWSIYATGWHHLRDVCILQAHTVVRDTGVARPTSTLCHRCAEAGKPPKAGFPASYIIISLKLAGIQVLYTVLCT